MAGSYFKKYAHRIFAGCFFPALLFPGAISAQTPKQTAWMDSVYADAGVEGAFYLVGTLNTKRGDKVTQTWTYNKEAVEEPVIPASTFKIPNTIIALETGVMSDESDTLNWDGVQRSVEAWNKTQTLTEAYRNSTVWFYQELARRIGSTNYRRWLRKLDYGNRDFGGGIDQFWLTGDLRISCKEQTAFLRKLRNREFPVSAGTYEKLRHIMFEPSAENYNLYGKTGWGYVDSTNIGWYVGYIESNGTTYYFAQRVWTTENNPDFGPLRRRIAYQALELFTGLSLQPSKKHQR